MSGENAMPQVQGVGLADPELRIALSGYDEFHERKSRGDVDIIEYSFMEFWLPYVITITEDW